MIKLIALALVSLFFSSCSLESEEDLVPDEVMQRESLILKLAEVSPEKDDPYFIDNINEAFRELALSKSRTAEDSAYADTFLLKPNYRHVRFLSTGKREALELYRRDTSLVLFTHPLDFKTLGQPAIYVDSSLTDSTISLFAVVPADYQFDSTRHEVIRDLFLMEPVACAESRDSALDFGIAWSELERLSFKKVGQDNIFVDEESPCQSYGGQLKFKDDLLGDQPVEGLKVVGGYGYVWRKTSTDRDGKFQIPGRWMRPVDFEAQFDNEEFCLRDGHSGYDELLAISSEGGAGSWNQVFTGTFAKWSIIWTAARQYWYGERFGMRLPRSSKDVGTRLDIFVYYKGDDAMKQKIASEGGAVPDNLFGHSVIDLENSSRDRMMVESYNRDSRDVFHSTIHETSHFSMERNRKKELDKKKKVAYMETFSRGVEWVFTNRRYCAINPNDVCSVLYQRNYTGLIQDLIDGDRALADVMDVGDFVSGFKIAELEEAMMNSSNFDEVKDYLLRNFPANQERCYETDMLDLLFDYWLSL